MTTDPGFLQLIAQDSKLNHDWTAAPNGASNSSGEYLRQVENVRRILMNSVWELSIARAEHVAHLIVSNMAHRQGFSPARLEENSENKIGDSAAEVGAYAALVGNDT